MDSTAPIGETRVKRIIIHGLRPEYRGFVSVVQGWPNQPSLVKFENLLAGQEAMPKQMAGLSVKNVKKPSTPTKVGTSSIKLLVGLRRKFFREMKIFSQGQFRRIKRMIKYSKGSVTTVGRRVLWKKTVGSRISPWKVMLLPQIQTRILKMFEMLKPFLLLKRRI